MKNVVTATLVAVGIIIFSWLVIDAIDRATNKPNLEDIDIAWYEVPLSNGDYMIYQVDEAVVKRLTTNEWAVKITYYVDLFIADSEGVTKAWSPPNPEDVEFYRESAESSFFRQACNSIDFMFPNRNGRRIYLQSIREVHL